MQPPPLPDATLHRIVRLSQVHGRTIMILSGLAAILGALGHQAAITVAAILAVGMGAFEMRGSQRVRAGDPRGVDWMVAGELGLMAVIFAYAGWMMSHYDHAEFMQQLPAWYLTHLETEMARVDLPPSELPAIFRFVNTLTYALLSGLTLIYQGGFALYYHRRRTVVAQALEQASAR